jgi:dolichol kinase
MAFELYRQIVHLSGLVFVILAQFVRKEIVIAYFSLIALSFFVYSWYVRSQEKKLENLLGRMESKFRNFTLKFERKNVNPFSGAFFFYAGCALAFLFFPLNIASAACAMLAVGDSFSTLAGKKFGRHKIGGKTLEGSLACFLSSFVAGIFFVSPVISIIGAFAAAASELLIPKLDDNITMPIVSGLVMFLASFV